jgi:anhydro-N-acetylmuramic acid kinase
MNPLLVLGIMSGTSIDGVDYALCSINVERIKLLEHWPVRFPPALRVRLHRAAQGCSSSHETAQLHHDLGRFYASHARGKRHRRRVALAGLHGQTIFHNPNSASPATFQLGEPAYLAETLRVPVVSNFRAADLAAGGQGAPLATGFHQTVFARRGRHVCVNNLGGISNVTSLDWRRAKHPALIKAFDTGPANMLLDLAMRRCTRDRMPMDEDGAWAARGTVSEPLLARWLKHPFFRKPPPKSTGREMFGERFFESILPQMRRAGMSKFDILATLTEFTARSIVLNYKLHLPSAPDVVILTGGGAANPALVAAIRRQLRVLHPDIEVQTSNALGWPASSIEAAAFAWLAYLKWIGRPGNIPQTTGANRELLLGQISEH